MDFQEPLAAFFWKREQPNSSAPKQKTVCDVCSFEKREQPNSNAPEIKTILQTRNKTLCVMSAVLKKGTAEYQRARNQNCRFRKGLKREQPFSWIFKSVQINFSFTVRFCRLGVSRAILGTSWGHLGAPQGHLGTFLGANMEPRWYKNSMQKSINKNDAFQDRCLMRFWWMLGRKMDPSWHWNGVLNVS